MTAVERPLSGHDPVDEAARQELGELFDIEILHRRGPASIVYIARDLEYNQRVAVKVMARSLDAGAVADEGFHRSAAAAAVLDHVHVVPMYSAGTTGHLFWYSLEYVEGSSLAELLDRDGPMQLLPCLRLVEQIGSALDYAHRRGVVHADLKPANVLLDLAGWARVTDFSIPRVLEQLGALAVEGKSSRRADYVAPEDALVRQASPHADQYALAVLVYECLSGKVPLAGDVVAANGQRSGAEAAPLLSDIAPEVPRHVAEAVARGLSATPGGRFPNVLDFVAALEAPAPAVTSWAVPSAPVQRPPVTLHPDTVPLDRPGALKRRWLSLGALSLGIIGVVAIVSVLSSGGTARETVAAGDAPGVVTPAPVLPRPDSTRRSDAARPPATPRATGAAVRTPPPRAASARPGRLFINATPWGQIYVDGVSIGNTPKADVPVTPGTHKVRIVRDGFDPFERTIRVASGEQLRLTDIVLRELQP